MVVIAASAMDAAARAVVAVVVEADVSEVRNAKPNVRNQGRMVPSRLWPKRRKAGQPDALRAHRANQESHVKAMKAVAIAVNVNNALAKIARKFRRTRKQTK